jgi:molecular chaperone GrpE (heat shock protein)
VTDGLPARRDQHLVSPATFSIAIANQIPYTSQLMAERVTTKLPKWPFFLGDFLLLVLAGFIIYQSAWPLGLWQISFCLTAVALGAYLSIVPFLREFHVSTKLAEANALSTALARIDNLQTIQDQIQNATNQWMTVQEHSARTAQTAKEIADQFKVDAQEASALLGQINDRETAHLRLEVEKLRRSERDWLQMTVLILDHVYALTHAAGRSGQPRLISQLSQFQQACRDAARRLGLVAYAATPDDCFDPVKHQTPEPHDAVSANARIAETVAAGFSFQGQLIRKAVVTLRPPSEVKDSETEDESIEKQPHQNGTLEPAPIGETSPTEGEPNPGQKELTLE